MSRTNLEKLLERRAQLEIRIQQIRSRAASEERKRDTRRKILVGAYVISLAEQDLSELGKNMIAAGLLTPADYALFGLASDDYNATYHRLDLV